MTLPTFHAKIAAQKQWKKWTKDAQAVYSMIVDFGMDLYRNKCYHPKMDIPKAQMQAIVHNIWRIVADEITHEQKEYELKNKKKK